MESERWVDTSPSLLITVDPQRSGITVAGEIDSLNAAQLHAAVLGVLRERPRHIEVDLRGVTFLDSAGIRTLLLCHTAAQHMNCRLTLTDAHPMAYRVL